MSKVALDLSSVTVVGLDLAKLVFQVCCVDAAGKVLVNRALKRREMLDFFRKLPSCRVGLEACGSSHHWGRQLLALGHDVKLIPPAYVKPYVRRQKNDATDAAAAKADVEARRLMTIPGIGPQTAHAIIATLGPDGIGQFSGPREFAAFLGLVPRQNSSGGKQRLGRISKMGNAYVRKLLVVGAHSVLHHRERHADALRTWAKALLANNPFKLVAVAIANKMARIVFALLSAQADYTAKAAAA